jgi:hypothetical protein
MFKVFILVFASMIIGNVALASCSKHVIGEPTLYATDFSWKQSLGQMKALFEKLYTGPKRLPDRFYLDGQEFLAPFKFMEKEHLLKVPQRFIDSVTKHIEHALERKYVDFIFFSDMGHSHFFVPNNIYYSEIEPIPSSRQHEIYQKFLNMKELKTLYHTAEQLKRYKESGKLLDDPYLQWRHFTRNIVGSADNQRHLEIIQKVETIGNAASSYDKDYRYWGGGYNFSANKDGCFSYNYNGKKYFYDISFSDLGYEGSLYDESGY